MSPEIESDLNKAYFMWLSELSRLEKPAPYPAETGLSIESLINFLQGTKT